MDGSHALNNTQVSWMVDDIEVYGTLTRPSGVGPFPAVVMVAGSGPTDRDWNSPIIPGTNGSAALLAEELTGAGFVTLRYDKRASGPHANENIPRLAGKISMQGHVDELAGGVEFLSKLDDVDHDHLFALTNSEGCIHALNYQIQATGTPFAGLVLTSAPARSVGAVGRGQIAAQLAGIPGGEQILLAYDQAIADFMEGRDVKMDENLPQGIRALVQAITNPFNQPFSKELWGTDPSMLLKEIPTPVLIVIGKKDIQVDWQLDGHIFEKLIQRQTNVGLAVIENANHVLKYEPTPAELLTPAKAMETYNAAGASLDEDAVEIILAWLKSHI